MQEDKKSLTFIDLFAGAGGLAEGFIRAGFKPIAFVEMDINSCLTVKTRLSYHYLKSNNKLNTHTAYLKKLITRDELYEQVPEDVLNSVINKEISSTTVKSLFKKIDNFKENKPVDIIIGGPPCQAYSLSGRAAKKNINIKKRDHRNFLYKYYGKFLQKYEPKLFLFENVPGLYSANGGKYYENMMGYFDRLGYSVKDSVCDAADFGVLQRRERIIVIGWKKELNLDYPTFEKVENEWTIKDLFYDLPKIKPGESREIINYEDESNEYLNAYEIRNGLDFTTWHITRPHNERDLNIYKIAIEKLENEGKRLKNNEIPEEIRTQKNITSFLDRFKVVDQNSISHTMIAHIAKDGHHFIHPDINQLRSISVREAARIQSFPDDYFFEGSRTSSFTQIGNAVPPLMAYQIALKIKEQICLKN